MDGPMKTTWYNVPRPRFEPGTSQTERIVLTSLKATFCKMPHYKVIKHTVGKHKQLYYKIHLLENEFFRINSLDRISACRTGSGTLYLLQRHTSQAAVSRLILCPTETYIGLVDAADVFTACNAHHKNSIYCTVQVLW